MPWCVTLPDDGNVIAETHSRDRNCTVVNTVCSYVGVDNQTHILIAQINNAKKEA